MAATIALSAMARADYIINIDNPSYRKLIAGVPAFESSEPDDADMQQLASQAQEELIRLLKFTDLFNVMHKSVFSGMKLRKPPVGKGIPGFVDVDVSDWKGLGIESLTMGKLIRQSSSKYRIEVRTADLNRGHMVLGKAYTMTSKKDLGLVLRQYVDRLLEAYTGKPGIFTTRLVFIGRRTKGSSKQVYVCDFDGSNLRQLTHKENPHVSPSWDPTGTKVVYTSYEDGNPDLFMTDVQTGKTRKLSGYRGLNSGGNFSPSGKVVAFTGSHSGNAEIDVTTPQGSPRKPLLVGRGLDVDPSFSPDGKWMAFVSGRFGNPHIFRAQLAWDGDTRVRVVADKRLTYAGWYNATPSWSPDSQKIAFAGFDKGTSRFDLFLMNHDGSNLERLTLKNGDNESPSWSPNGQLIAFHSNRVGDGNVKGRSKLFIMSRDGSNQRRVPVPLYDAQTPKWGPYLLSRDKIAANPQ